MRGMTMNLTIGERVAWYRRRRGLSQEVLAGLIGRTADWLGKIENNRIELDRLSVIKSLADVLDVSLGDLLAEPSLVEWSNESGMETVPALRAALMEYQALTSLGTRDLGPEPPSLDGLRKEAGKLWESYQASRFGYVTGQLPGLLRRAQAAVDVLGGADQDEARSLLGLTYQLAATQLTKLGEPDLAWIAADRGLAAVRPVGDPAITGSLFRSVSHALLSTGRYQDAVRLTTDAADFLDQHLTEAGPELLSVYGTLLLGGSVAAARANDAGTARTFLTAADEAAVRLGGDANQPVDRFRADERCHSPGSCGRRTRERPGGDRTRAAREHLSAADGAPGAACAGGVAGVQLVEPSGRGAVGPPRRRADGAGAGSASLPGPSARAHLDQTAARQAVIRDGRPGTPSPRARLIHPLYAARCDDSRHTPDGHSARRRRSPLL
ncbi:hypothetical protein Aca07nite_44950 [Actinoplanes capillaceus]|uniref:HTH cro/C1-type domain-containing protein n=1 Tax=Actinoplanes campanulatus TaxID=113559 RepID=A0ABQ3WLX9_9ACTN|nr:helix-turn-helix domain-containing protein [Actinoplanes capillaceus]GID47220.1 hypothetical protein Aca07nite_44950 [Actinoplanes capillaceus]